ncbi:MAG TPA: hypothetical protein VIL69_00840, partial [Roseomonas sp.]
MTPFRQAFSAATILIAASSGLQAQNVPRPSLPPTAGKFIEIILTDGRAPVWIAALEVVRVAEIANQTVLDTTAWVQQRTDERVEPI